MTESVRARPFVVDAVGVALHATDLGRTHGTDLGGRSEAIVLGHGLTATRHYTVMGSKALPRAGYRLVTYDARGHGESDPAPSPAGYEYRDLVADLEAVLDGLEIERAVVGGASMGAATALAFALEHPERVSALVVVTPACGEHDLEEWARLADGLRDGGVEGFMDAYRPRVAERWREAVLTATRQRLERHLHPDAVADALRVVPRSAAFEGLDALQAIEVPALVVGSGDEADPGHPLAVAEEYARRIPRAELVTEEPGRSPLAWQGARLSRAIAEFLA